MEPNNIGNLIHRPTPTIPELPKDNNNRKKILIAVGAVVLIGVGLYLVKNYKGEEEKSKIATEELGPPALLEQRKVFKITEVADNFFKGQELESSKEITIYVPKGVEPYFINIKKAEIGYFIELFKYREVAEGVIAHALNVTATDPHKKFDISLSEQRKIIGGVVKDLAKDGFTVVSSQPGNENRQTHKIKVLSGTVFTKINTISKTQESAASFKDLLPESSVIVYYTYNSSEVQAEKVQILNNFQLPIGSAR